MEEVAKWVSFLAENHKVWVFGLLLFFILVLGLIYLFLALIIHRKDRKALEQMAVSMGVNLLFRYSWRGVELKISHPTDRSPPTQGNQPPSPPAAEPNEENRSQS